MRISIVVSALTFTGCGDSKTAVNNQPTVKTPRKKVPVEAIRNAGLLGLEEPQNSIEDVGEQGSKSDENAIKIKVDLEKAKDIHEYLKAVAYVGLKPGENLGRCYEVGSIVDIGDGEKALKRKPSAGWWVPDVTGTRYYAREMIRERDFRGYRLQEKLFAMIKDGVLALRRPKYLDAEKTFCDGFIVFEKADFYLPFENDGNGHLAAARALEILKELHQLGIIHGQAGGSFQWWTGDIESLRLGDFSSAEFYVDTDTGDLIPGKSPAVDLEAFAETFLPNPERDNFLKAISEGFDYDYWISHFK